MTVRTCLPWPDKRLRTVSEPVDEITDEVRQVWDDLIDTMYAMPGVGMGANQIGVLKRLIVVEDSVVRGTTTRAKMDSLRRAGAKEIHLRVASPPIRFPCHYGIDFPQKEELIANQRSVDEIRDYLGIDSLVYLSHDQMLDCVQHANSNYCTACFSGTYPMQIDENFRKDVFENV